MTEELTDDIGGYHTDPALEKWPCGSMWGSEGLYLYRWVRENRPKIIVAVGTFYGCSTSHLALACKHNKFGHVYSIDNCVGIGDQTGSMIPKELLPWTTLIRHDATDPKCPWANAMRKQTIQCLVEDGAHTTGFTKAVLENFTADTVICHDALHRTAGPNVLPEAISVLGEPDELFIEPPADCGLGRWTRKKDVVK